MRYKEAIRYIENLPKFGDEIGLHRMESILAALGNPQNKLRYVHVTGTNGKGSTCAMINSILISAGYNVGMFTSPHLFRYNERIKVNNQVISDNDFADYAAKIKKVIDKLVHIGKMGSPVLFEAITVLALLYFYNKKTDIVILEVGIGGLLDSTNIIEHSLSIITNIDLEHTYLLGGTKKEIAIQKAGIIKPNSIVITSEQNKIIRKIFQRKAKELNSSLIIINPTDIKLIKKDINGQHFNLKDMKNVIIPFLGEHQLYNASLAILCSKNLDTYGFKISRKNIFEGLIKTEWPLRLEITKTRPKFLLDVGHNIHGVKTIHKVINDFFSDKKRILVIGCSNDKPFQEMTRILSKESETVIVTKAKYHGANPKEIARYIPSNKRVYITKNVSEAIRLSKRIAKKDDIVMIFGGLYLAAEAKIIIDKVCGN